MADLHEPSEQTMTEDFQGMYEKNSGELRRMYEYRYEVTPDGYVNYGDANPDLHGGIWVQYDDGWWDVIETTHASVYDKRFDDTELGHQFVSTAEVHWSDVVNDDGTWEGRYGRIPETVYGGHKWPLGAIVDNDLDKYVAHESRKQMTPYEQPLTLASYDAVLDRYNVTPAEP